MARKKSSKTRTAAETPQQRTAEDLDDEQHQALFFQHKTAIDNALAVKKKADADFKNACKRAKAELGAGAVRDIKIANELKTDAGEAAIRDQIMATLRVAKWLGAGLGTQFEMFDGPDRTPAVDRAYADGKRAGLNGETAKPPHDPSTEQYGKWMEGYHAAQATLAGGFKKKDDAAASEGESDDEPPARVPRSEFMQGLREMTARTPRLGDAPSTAVVD